MRKLILASALAATLVPTLVSAQSYGEVRGDTREIQHDRRDIARARDDGDPRAARDARRDLADDRAERRGDWRDYRRAHPDAFRGPGYAAPRAEWRYRPVAAGTRFEPAFYDRRYWIEPTRYRLPVYGQDRRWVRYGNDVVLVNLRTGRVLTVYNGFFS